MQIIDKINDIINKLKKDSDTALPIAVKELRDKRKFETFMYHSWREPTERAYTPLVNRLFFNSDTRIPFNAGLLDRERAFIISQGNALRECYGDPVFDYSKVTEDKWPAVDNWQALLKMSPMSTRGASKRRYENTMAYLGPKKFTPDCSLFETAWKYTLELLKHNLSEIKPLDSKVIDAAGPFKQLSSNVGFPFYSNELKTDGNGVTYRELSYKLALELLQKYKTKWIYNVPASIIGRSQNAGLDITPNNNWAQLQKRILEERNILKPSKERPVFAVSRAINNIAAPYIHPAIDEFKKNPIWCSYLDKDARKDFMSRYHYTWKHNKLFSANVDYASFDTTVSAEMIVAAALLFLELEPLDDHFSNDIFWAFITYAIYTPFEILNPVTSKIERFKTEGTMPSGIIITNLFGGIINLLNRNYCFISMYGLDKVKQIDSKFIQNNTFPVAVAGDDLLTWLASPKDINKMSKIAASAFGFNIPTDGIKTQWGTMFLKERFQDDKIFFPTPAVTVKCLWVERPKGLNWTLWDLGFASKLHNMKENPNLIITVAMLMALDKTRLGLISPDGIKQNVSTFRRNTAQESAKYGNTPLQVVWDGNPSKQSQYDSNGLPEISFLDWYFTVLERVVSSTYYPTYMKIFAPPKEGGQYPHNKTSKGKSHDQTSMIKDNPVGSEVM